jgi:hypothetical protein
MRMHPFGVLLAMAISLATNRTMGFQVIATGLSRLLAFHSGYRRKVLYRPN